MDALLRSYRYWGAVIAFAVSAAAALVWDWQATDLAWGLWISSLLTGWVIVVFAVLRTVLHAAGVARLPVGEDPSASGRLGQVLQTMNQESRERWSGWLLSVGAAALGLFTFFHFTLFHGILGLLMSVFLAAEPAELLGPNGFINAEFSDVVTHLLGAYLAIILSTLLIRWRSILQGNPIQRMQSIYPTVIRLHVFVVLSGFLSFVLVFGKAVYQQVMVLTLLFLCFFPFDALNRGESDA